MLKFSLRKFAFFIIFGIFGVDFYRVINVWEEPGSDLCDSKFSTEHNSVGFVTMTSFIDMVLLGISLMFPFVYSSPNSFAVIHT